MNKSTVIAPKSENAAAEEGVRPSHPAIEFVRAFARNQSAVVGFVLLTAILVLSVAGPFLYPVDPYDMVDMPLLPPGSEFVPLGTDYLGRDILAGIIGGARATLAVGGTAAIISVVIGILAGSFAGFFGGRVDAALIKLTEFFQILPPLLLAMVLVTIFGPTLTTIALSIGVVSWPQVARLARAEFMKIGRLDYVSAARTAGAGNLYLIFRVILPAALPPLVVAAGLSIGAAILFEAGLSFLGLGDPNVMSWGLIIGQNRDYLLTAWWPVTLPGIAIFLTVLAISLVGDGINDALNPKLRRR